MEEVRESGRGARRSHGEGGGGEVTETAAESAELLGDDETEQAGVRQRGDVFHGELGRRVGLGGAVAVYSLGGNFNASYSYDRNGTEAGGTQSEDALLANNGS